jgi:hypothetical protein
MKPQSTSRSVPNVPYGEQSKWIFADLCGNGFFALERMPSSASHLRQMLPEALEGLFAAFDGAVFLDDRVAIGR